jgi:hypothetical protein
VRDAVLVGGDAADWVWLVDGDTEPAPGALAELAAVAQGRDGVPTPALLTSKVVGRDGRLDHAAAPWPPLHDRSGAIGAARHRLAAVRLARWGSLLVSADAVARHGPPRADLIDGSDDLDWTARILRDGRGYLVPESVVVRERPRRGGGRRLLGTTRMLAGSGLDPHERLWFVYASLLEGSRPSPSWNARQTVRRLAAFPRLVRR